MPVSQSEFERAFNVVHETAGKLNLDMHPTYFETVTAMALWLFRERGVLLRPLGNTVYVMPPYCVSGEQLDEIYDAIREGVSLLD